MKNYLVKAIEEGSAIDAYKYPEKVRKVFEDGLSFLGEYLSGVNEIIDFQVNQCRDTGVVFWGDVRMTIMYVIARNFPKYIQEMVKDSKSKLFTPIKKGKK